MADGYRYPQQTAGNFFHQQHQYARQHPIRASTPPENHRSNFSAVNTPSPSRSPDPHSPARHVYGMFNQGHQGQHGRVNGAGRGLGMGVHNIHNYQHQNTHQQYSQHHTNIQQDHNTHASNGAIIGHHTTYSSGLLSSTTPNFTPSSLQNGHSGTTRGGQAQQITEHWAKQLELHKESERAHNAMETGSSHHYARHKAQDNKAAVPPAVQPPSDGQDEDGDVLRMSDQSASQRRQAWFSMDLSGQGLRVLAKPLFNYDFLKELYVASNKLTEIPPSISKLQALEILDASNNQLTQLPPELGICVFLKQLLLFDNRIQTLPHELGFLYKLEMLGIEGNPLEASLKEVIQEKGTKELIEQLLESAPVPMPPSPRQLLTLQETPNLEKFKVFSYNILADATCTREAYGYSPKGALAWDHRKEQILQEIQSQDADFVCLQEIGTETFKEYFSMKLAYSEYKGIFWARTRSRTMSEKEAKAVDGCAIFYKYNKYILLDKQLMDFAQIGINRLDMKGQRDMFNRIMNRDHIGVLGFFENRLTGSRLMMATTHLFWDPRFSDVKLVQAALLLAEINKLADKYVKWPACEDKKSYTIAEDKEDAEPVVVATPEPSKEYSSKTQIPLVICADQNSGPDSAIYQLMVNGSLPKDHNDIKDFSYGNLTKDGIEHPFSLKSAYSNLDRTPEEMPWTNYTPNFKDNIDHIWYSANVLDNTALLGQIDPEYMKRVPGFPNYHYPSDHISLMAEFAVKQTKSKKAIVEPDFGPSSRKDGRKN